MFHRIKWFCLSFTAAFFCFSLMVMAAVLWVRPFSPVSEPVPSSAVYLPQKEDARNILVSFHASGQAPHTLLLFSVNPYDGKIPVAVFSPETILPGAGGLSLNVLYQNGRMETIRQAVSAEFSIPVHHCMEITAEGFSELLDSLGAVPLELPRTVSYSLENITVVLNPGLQAIDGNKAFFLLSDSRWESFLTGKLFSNFLRQHLGSLLISENQDAFQLLLDHTETDLSILDYGHFHSSAVFMSQLVPDPVFLLPYCEKSVPELGILSPETYDEITSAFSLQ